MTPSWIAQALERCTSRSLDDKHDREAVGKVLTEASELDQAKADAALDSLGSLVRYVQRVGGFMSAEDQATLRGARALLAEMGRKL